MTRVGGIRLHKGLRFIYPDNGDADSERFVGEWGGDLSPKSLSNARRSHQLDPSASCVAKHLCNRRLRFPAVELCSRCTGLHRWHPARRVQWLSEVCVSSAPSSCGTGTRAGQGGHGLVRPRSGRPPDRPRIGPFIYSNLLSSSCHPDLAIYFTTLSVTSHHVPSINSLQSFDRARGW